MGSFRTEIEVLPIGLTIDYTNKGLCIGSCFAGNIAQMLSKAKFPVAVNPFGVMYNPMSIAENLQRLAAATPFTQDDLALCDELWCNFKMHGNFSALSKESALERMNNAVTQGAKALKEADYIIITFGTAYVYSLCENGDIVANCHKFPTSKFTRSRADTDEIVALYDHVLQGALSDKKVIFTLSPIRHRRDGFQQNTISKATLALAIDKIIARHKGQCCYFPSYEIMMDDLRDYRFYEPDMVHPSAVAIDYIRKLFTESTISPTAKQIMNEIEAITDAAAHRPFNPNSRAHLLFCKNMATRIEALQKKIPSIDLSQEKEFFTQQK